MYLVGIFILIPILFPFVIGVLLGLGIRKTRSDLVALLASLFILLIMNIFMNRIGLHNNVGLLLLPQTIATTTILILCVLSSISMSLIFPYIFSRWGIELADRIRTKNSSSIRHSSKGNRVLRIIFVILFAGSIAQTIPTITSAVREAQEQTQLK